MDSDSYCNPAAGDLGKRLDAACQFERPLQFFSRTVDADSCAFSRCVICQADLIIDVDLHMLAAPMTFGMFCGEDKPQLDRMHIM